MKNMYLGRSKGEKSGEKFATFSSNKVCRSQGSLDDDCENMYKLKFDKLVGLVNGRRWRHTIAQFFALISVKFMADKCGDRHHMTENTQGGDRKSDRRRE